VKTPSIAILTRHIGVGRRDARLVHLPLMT
jgi:hypothetical protein